jgi:myo-inositol 2-dehydrogenase / D-chiro-inositol 1-dehydrogenase
MVNSSSEGFPGPERIELAVIGCGMMGTIRARVAAHSAGVRSIRLFDTDEGKAQRLAEEIGATVCRSADEALAGADAALISTRPGSHHELGLRAIAATRAVFVEKPFTRETATALDLTKAAADHDVGLFAGYTQRFRQNYMTAKYQVQLGQIGQATGGLITFYTTRARAENRLRREPSGSPTANNFPHAADLALWFMGEARPIRITAVTSRGPLGEHRDVALTAWCLLEFDTGAVVTIGTSWELPKQYPAYHATMGADLFGTAGVIRIDDSHRDVFLSSDDRVTTLDAPDMPPLDLNHVFMGTFPPGSHAFGELWGPAREETEAFIRCALNGDRAHPVLPDGHAAVAVRRVIDAASASLERGRPVEI